jgi:diguanylate cyclase (GGDEF)-like protein
MNRSESIGSGAADAAPELLRLGAAAVESLPGEIAVLNRDAIIMAVNRAWREASDAHGRTDPLAGVGRSYLELCPADASADVDGGAPLRERIASVAAGGEGFELTYPCHTPDRARWFRLTASPLDPSVGGAVVMHLDVTDQVQSVGGAVVMHLDVTDQVQSEVRLHRLANYDELTGVLRRRRFMERLEEAVQTARRYGHPLALAVADLDRFKGVNDARGHAFGDACLAAFATELQSRIRTTDFIGRFGGDEFTVCFPFTRAEDAVHSLNRIREALKGRGRILGHPALSATFGVAELGPEHADLPQLLAAADGALYRGKASGRDRVEIAAPTSAASTDA